MNSTMVIVEPWFIPMDIIAILHIVLTIILAIMFLFIIVLDKTCHTVPMLLTANICLTGCVSGVVFLAKNVFTLHNDLKQIHYENIICYIIGYLLYAASASHNYSYVLVAIYRYLAVVYPTKLVWQTARVQILFIILSWFFVLIVPIPIVFTGPLVYNADNQICQAPFRLSFAILYAPSMVYVVPVQLVVFTYRKLVRYVRAMNQRVTPANTVLRVQRDLKMVRQIVILIYILFISGFPLTLFAFLSFANLAPKYYFRIGFLFVEVARLFVMIAIFHFNDSFKISVKKIIYPQSSRVIPQIVT